MTSPTNNQPARGELFPFREQEPFLTSKRRYYGYISGVGAGKTRVGAMRTAMNMEDWNAGEMGAIVAPTATMVKDVIIPLCREMGLLDRWEYKSPHSDEPGLHAPNGSRALILSADNRRTVERLAGLNLAWFWLDEASRVPERALEILTQRLRVGDYMNGYVTTTPMGRDHIYEFFVGDHDGEWSEHGRADVYNVGDRLAITRVPTDANPFTPEDYKEQMRQKEGQTYEREILGRFVDYEGLVYPWFQALEDHQHVQPPEDIQDDSFRQTLYGVDWGHNNPSVILAIRLTSNGEYYVVDELYEPRLTVNDLADYLGELQRKHRPGRVYCDPAEPASIETLERAGFDATGGQNDLMPGIQQVTAARDRLYVSENCRNLIDEFGMYRYPDAGDGEKPVDANNHALDALRYSIMTHEVSGEWNVGVAFG